MSSLHKKGWERNHPSLSLLWVVGLVERDNTPARRLSFCSEKRGANVLIPFIRKWVKDGTTLMSNMWSGYGKDLQQWYKHYTVNHKEEYARKEVVDGEELNINTNHIEREWRELRKMLEDYNEREYPGQINKEIFRVMFLSGHPREEWPFIFLQKMGKLRNK